MFKDKVYEEMDDVSKMFEPFQYDLNDELSRFPDRVEIKFEDLVNSGYSGYGFSYGLDLPTFIHKLAIDMNMLNIADNVSMLTSHDFFKFEAETENAEIWLDADKETITHKIFLVKNKIAFDERQLEDMSKDYIIGQLKRNFYTNREMNKARFNEVADLYGAKTVKSERSYGGKLSEFCNHIKVMLDDKTLDIRDMSLVHKFVHWIVLYVKHGNLAALNNLTRIKIMTHEKRPIYSIEEKEIT